MGVKLPCRWSGWGVALVSLAWLTAVPLTYVPLREWWAVRDANARPHMPGEMQITYSHVGHWPSAAESVLLVVLLFVPPVLLVTHWLRAHRFAPARSQVEDN